MPWPSREQFGQTWRNQQPKEGRREEKGCQDLTFWGHQRIGHANGHLGSHPKHGSLWEWNCEGRIRRNGSGWRITLVRRANFGDPLLEGDRVLRGSWEATNLQRCQNENAKSPPKARNWGSYEVCLRKLTTKERQIFAWSSKWRAQFWLKSFIQGCRPNKWVEEWAWGIKAASYLFYDWKWRWKRGLSSRRSRRDRE